MGKGANFHSVFESNLKNEEIGSEETKLKEMTSKRGKETYVETERDPGRGKRKKMEMEKRKQKKKE
jgi:hypothetical protein